ncbi:MULTISPECIES: hypothetical protein [Streptomyces]|uniref:hypothetical protein n=1 Tax=Streptomyces TaxID=1883 RepID=UPI0033C6F1C6
MPSADRRLQPRRKPRQVRAELTRDRALTAAAHVFAEHGYAAGTTNRVAKVRDLGARHPDVHVQDLDTAAELIVFTVKTNTHKLMAYPRTTPVETFENELVAMATRYLRGRCSRPPACGSSPVRA